MSPLPEPLASLFRDRDCAGRSLTVGLPAGRIVLSTEVENWPALWLSDEAPPPGLWAQLRAAQAESGLWPLVLEGLSHDHARPWDDGELWPHWMSAPETHSAEEVLAQMWADHTDVDPEDGEDPLADIAPFGGQWPGMTVRPAVVASPDQTADNYADTLLASITGPRLGLVAADRGADALAVAGWMGPANYTNDTGRLAAVLRNWEERFGARVVGVGFDTLYLTVAAPPQTAEEALQVAAEHYAFCPDNVWQGWHPFTLAGYAERLVGATSWTFWWD